MGPANLPSSYGYRGGSAKYGKVRDRERNLPYRSGRQDVYDRLGALADRAESSEAGDRLRAFYDRGSYRVDPIESTDPAVKQRMNNIRGEGRASGEAAARDIQRRAGAGSEGIQALARLRGAASGSQGAAAYGLEEAKWRTGVEQSNADRALSSLGLLSQNEGQTRGQQIQALLGQLGVIDSGDAAYSRELANAQAQAELDMAGRVARLQELFAAGGLTTDQYLRIMHLLGISGAIPIGSDSGTIRPVGMRPATGEIHI